MSIRVSTDDAGTISIFFRNISVEETIDEYIDKYYFRVNLVFFDEPNKVAFDYLLNNQESIKNAKSRILHFVGVSPHTAKAVTNKIQDIFSIDSVSVPIAEIYNYLDEDEYRVGIEQWVYLYGSIGSIECIDRKLQKIYDCKKLIPYAEKIADSILDYNPQNVIEKVVLFDLWIQKHIQYIKKKESKRGDEVYICADFEKSEADADDVLLNHFGRCQDIAFTAALVLNHPKLNVACRQISSVSCNHSWNIITCNDLEYYTDFTHNITRNPYQVQGALKAYAYCPQFTLLGRKETQREYVNSDIYDTSNVAEESVSREFIIKAAEKFKALGVETKWGAFLVKDSYLKE